MCGDKSTITPSAFVVGRSEGGASVGLRGGAEASQAVLGDGRAVPLAGLRPLLGLGSGLFWAVAPAEETQVQPSTTN